MGPLTFVIEVAMLHINNTPLARDFLTRWAERCRSDAPVGDHAHALPVWEEMEKEGIGKLRILPRTFCDRQANKYSIVSLITSRFDGKTTEMKRAVGYHNSRLPERVYWWQGVPNWGDWITPLLMQDMGVSITPAGEHDSPKTLCVGSVVRCAKAGDVVWGSGISKRDNHVEPGATYHAVRGPLSRARILDRGGKCPAVFGDPALLLPRYHAAAPVRTHAVGIVPHHYDYGLLKISHEIDPSVRIIDGRTTQALSVIGQITACEAIVSSSLHGLIVAHAYGIPALWIKFSDRNPPGDDVKFHDHYASLSIRSDDPVRADPTRPMSAARLARLARNVPMTVDLDRLMQACPFRS